MNLSTKCWWCGAEEVSGQNAPQKKTKIYRCGTKGIAIFGEPVKYERGCYNGWRETR